ncbi:MAG: pilus assembly protein PilM [Elusimicrobia bacterium]|nr:pilus assembly protein PilM [Candidatus Liberimonas magnetica]
MIGLDIGTKNIKICRVEQNDAAYNIVAAAVTANPESNIPNENKGHQFIVNKLKSICKETGCSKKQIISSIGGTNLIVRYFSFPLLSEEELKGALQIEVQQSLTVSLDTLYNDFNLLPQLEKNKLDVMFVAVPKNIIDDNTKIISDAGLDLNIMDIDNLALTNCFLVFGGEAVSESVILLDIGHTYTNISVIENGKLRFIKNVKFGGKDISDAIADAYGIPYEMAEIIKKKPDRWDEIGLNIRSILQKSMPNLLETIYRTIEYCINKDAVLNIDKILITGGASYTKNIDKFIGDVLDIPTLIWNPIADLEIQGNSKKELGRFLGVALGLALRYGKTI